MAARLALALIPMLLCASARAQTVVAPASSPPQPCFGGGSSPISSVSTSPTTVCSAALNGRRSWWRVANTGQYQLYCVDDGSVVSSTNWTFLVPATSWVTSDGQNVSPLALSCLSLGGATSVSAAAVQSGQP